MTANINDHILYSNLYILLLNTAHFVLCLLILSLIIPLWWRHICGGTQNTNLGHGINDNLFPAKNVIMRLCHPSILS